MGARRASEGERDFVAFNANGDLILRAGEREANPLLACQQRTRWQFLKDRRQLVRGEVSIAIVALRRGLPGWNKRHCSRAFAADLLQQRGIIARADPEISGD